MAEKVRSYYNSIHAASINLVLKEVHEDPTEFLIESGVVPKYSSDEFMVIWSEAMGLEGAKLPIGALKKIFGVMHKDILVKKRTEYMWAMLFDFLQKTRKKGFTELRLWVHEEGNMRVVKIDLCNLDDVSEWKKLCQTIQDYAEKRTAAYNPEGQVNIGMFSLRKFGSQFSAMQKGIVKGQGHRARARNGFSLPTRLRNFWEALKELNFPTAWKFDINNGIKPITFYEYGGKAKYWDSSTKRGVNIWQEDVPHLGTKSTSWQGAQQAVREYRELNDFVRIVDWIDDHRQSLMRRELLPTGRVDDKLSKFGRTIVDSYHIWPNLSRRQDPAHADVVQQILERLTNQSLLIKTKMLDIGDDVDNSGIVNDVNSVMIDASNNVSWYLEQLIGPKVFNRLGPMDLSRKEFRYLIARIEIALVEAVERGAFWRNPGFSGEDVLSIIANEVMLFCFHNLENPPQGTVTAQIKDILSKWGTDFRLRSDLCIGNSFNYSRKQHTWAVDQLLVFESLDIAGKPTGSFIILGIQDKVRRGGFTVFSDDEALKKLANDLRKLYRFCEGQWDEIISDERIIASLGPGNDFLKGMTIEDREAFQNLVRVIGQGKVDDTFGMLRYVGTRYGGQTGMLLGGRQVHVPIELDIGILVFQTSYLNVGGFLMTLLT